MKRFIYILLLLLTLPFRNGLGVGYCAYAASPYGVQVQMAAPKSNTSGLHMTSSARVSTVGSGGAYTPALPMSTTTRQANKGIIPSGRFSTSVPTLDANGHAYTPSQITAGETSLNRSHIRKVSHDDDEDDPYLPSNVVPLGSTPWVLFLLLMIAYFGLKIRKNRKKRLCDAFFLAYSKKML